VFYKHYRNIPSVNVLTLDCICTWKWRAWF